jgi:hypothetical protein
LIFTTHSAFFKEIARPRTKSDFVKARSKKRTHVRPSRWRHKKLNTHALHQDSKETREWRVSFKKRMRAIAGGRKESSAISIASNFAAAAGKLHLWLSHYHIREGLEAPEKSVPQGGGQEIAAKVARLKVRVCVCEREQVAAGSGCHSLMP